MKESLIERLIIWRFCKVALMWGDWESYSFMATNESNPYQNAFNRMERLYDWLGYERVPTQVWVAAGGYGRAYKHYLRKIPRPDNEISTGHS